MMKPAVIVPEDQPFTLATLPPGRAQKRFALGVILAFLGAVLVLAGELSNVQLGRIDAFVAAYGTAMFVSDMITAVLLFNQFAILRSRALLAISIGYLFTGLMLVPGCWPFRGCSHQMACLAPGYKARTGSKFCDSPVSLRSSSRMPF